MTTSPVIHAPPPVIPAEAGIHFCYQSWTLAFARVTEREMDPRFREGDGGDMIPAKAGIYFVFRN